MQSINAASVASTAGKRGVAKYFEEVKVASVRAPALGAQSRRPAPFHCPLTTPAVLVILASCFLLRDVRPSWSRRFSTRVATR